MDIDYPVQLVPQPTDMSCWAAAIAMLVGYRDSTSYTPDAIAAQVGMDTSVPYAWSVIQSAISD
jgi:hypothetical protein